MIKSPSLISCWFELSVPQIAMTTSSSYSLQRDNLRVDYELCSIASSNETADNLPGHGRLLGNLFTLIGQRFEHGLSSTAKRMGYGPRVTAKRILRIYDNDLYPARCKKLRRNSACLVRYAGYAACGYRHFNFPNTVRQPRFHIGQHVHSYSSTTTSPIANRCFVVVAVGRSINDEEDYDGGGHEYALRVLPRADGLFAGRNDCIEVCFEDRVVLDPPTHAPCWREVRERMFLFE